MRKRVLACCASIAILAASVFAEDTTASSNIRNFAELKTACSEVGTPIILVNVWAVNCSHCMDELTLLSKFAREQFIESKELGFLGVCLADSTISDFNARTKEILLKKKAPYKSVVWNGDLSTLQKELQLDATPYTALLDSKGNLLDVLELPHNEEKAEAALRDALRAALKKLGNK